MYPFWHFLLNIFPWCVESFALRDEFVVYWQFIMITSILFSLQRFRNFIMFVCSKLRRLRTSWTIISIHSCWVLSVVGGFGSRNIPPTCSGCLPGLYHSQFVVVYTQQHPLCAWWIWSQVFFSWIISNGLWSLYTVNFSKHTRYVWNISAAHTTASSSRSI